MVVLIYIFTGKIDWYDTVKQSKYFIFSVIIPTMMIAIALGVVIGVQIGPEFVSRGLGNQLGILSAIVMSRELIPVVGSMMIATQYGTGLASEVANMKITEQIDALKIFDVNPNYYITTPRLISGLVFTPIVIFLSSIVAVFSSYVTVWIKEDLSLQGFLSSIWAYFHIKDLLLCLFKGSVFGTLIVLIAITLGFEAQGGAKAVGRATTMTVILSFIFIVLVDYFITMVYL